VPMLTDSDNDLLCSIPDEPEIFQAVSNLGSNKAECLAFSTKISGLWSRKMLSNLSGLSFVKVSFLRK
jgi:hypothetical protein